jgi:hypothetical protein
MSDLFDELIAELESSDKPDRRLAAELLAMREAIAIARFIALNKQNFLRRDIDGQAERTLDALAAVLAKLGDRHDIRFD